MADQIVDTLRSLAQAFSVLKTPGPGPHSFDVQLVTPSGCHKKRSRPRPSAPDILIEADCDEPITIVESLVETVIKAANVDLTALLKDVRFATAPITDGVPIGGQPISDLLIPGITAGFTPSPAPPPPLPGVPAPPPVPNPPGVAGIIAALQGTIPIPVQQIVDNPLHVAVDVRWTVLDENGNPASDVTWVLDGTQGQGGDIPFKVGEALLPLALSFLPTIVELTANLALTSKRTIKASIRLTATGVGGAFRATSGWVDLPPLDVILPVIPVPTIAIFFSASGFAGDTLIAVPSSSPLEEDNIMPALDQLNTVLGTLGSAVAIGGFFVDGLAILKTALASGVTKLVFRKGDSCVDLREVKFAGASFWFDWNGEDGDDHFAAIMLIGPPNRSIECFNDRHLKTSEGQMTLSVYGDLFASVENLGTADPVSEPPQHVLVPHKPDAWNYGRARNINKFTNELSSYRFAWV